ncbi:natural cytotoxicity triggering receptor 3 ligand 1 isoform X2 [Eleutherodactylus coqui]|uniref:natural cytotoxicity triggering receptor 3 ligand 1 isoform X2 n=1 Tax=Eleutherodactylus coqui TaxID=57060 RepID=UPI003461F10F
MEAVYLLLVCLVTADGLRVTMRAPLISVLREENVTIPCQFSEFSAGQNINVHWSKTQNGSSTVVYNFIPGRPQNRSRMYMGGESEIQRGNATLHIPWVQFSDEGEYTCTVIVTPEFKEGRSSLEVSAPPVVVLTPADAITVELGSERSVGCEVSSFYPKDINIFWARHERNSSDCKVLQRGTCTGGADANADATFNVTSHLTLYPTMEDDGYQYSCVVNHRSLRQDLRKDFTLTVTERENNSARVTAAVICTFVAAALLFAAGAVSYQAFKKDPPTMSEITGNDQLIDMTRTTLTCCILNYKRKDLEISVTLKRHGVEMIIGTLRLGDHHVSSDEGNDGGGSVERQSLMNRDVSPTEGPLQLTIKPNVTKIKPRLLRCVPWRRLSSYNCQCSLHITPSFSEDDGAELSVHVTHSTLVKPDPKNKTTLKDPVSKKKTLRVVGAVPELASIKQTQDEVHSGGKVYVGKTMKLSCKICSFFPAAPIEVTWHTRDGQILPSDTNDALPDPSGRYHVTSTMTHCPTLQDLRKTFICEVKHPSSGAPRTAVWTLDDLVSEPAVSDIRSAAPTCHSGDLVALSCDVSRLYPNTLVVHWYKGTSLMPGSMCGESLEEDAASGMFGGSVQLSFVADAGHHEEEFRMEMLHCGKTIDRRFRLLLEGFPVLGDIISEPREPSYGRPVTLHCKVTTSNPQDVVVRWLKGEKPLEEGQGAEPRITKKDGALYCSLRITPTALDYAKAYACSVKHNDMASPIKKNHYLALLDQAPRFSVITVQPERAVAGKEAKFTVAISGFSTDIRVKWYKGFQPFPSAAVVTSDPQLGKDFLLTCSSTLRFTPQHGDHEASVRCEATHSVTKKVHGQSYTLRLAGRPSDEPEQCISRPDSGRCRLPVKTRGIQCLTEGPRVGGNVTLTCYVDGCDAERLDFSWRKGLFAMDSGLVNKTLEDGSGSSSTVTFKAEEADRDCMITCEVTYNLQTQEEHFTLKLQ